MNDDKRSPIVIPTLLIHVGIIGILSSMHLATLNSPSIDKIGGAGMCLSGFFLIVSFFTLQILQRNPNYQNDVNLAHQASNFLGFPLSNVIYLFLAITDFPICLTVISILFIFAAQLYFRKMIAIAVTSYCHLLRYHEPPQLKYYFYTFVIFTNVISLSITIYFYVK